MRTTTLLRSAAVLALLQYTAHTALFLFSSPAHGAEELTVIGTMKSHHFLAGGFERSYWDFFFGYGLLAILSGVIEVVLLWQLATLAQLTPARVRPIIALFAFANVAHAAVCWAYFFPTPIVADILIALVLVWAFVTAEPKAAPMPLATP